MKSVSILLVDNPGFDFTKVDLALKETGLNCSLYFAASGKSGLDILMGDPYHEMIALDEIKTKPNIVILSNELKDISAREFLGIINKYYSLKDTRVFLLSDALNDSERDVYDALGILGYFQRPLNKQQIVQHIKPLMVKGKAHLALIPFALLRSKLAKAGLEMLIKTKAIGLGLSAKVAASLASALIISSVAIYQANTYRKRNAVSDFSQTSFPLIKPVVVVDTVKMADEEPQLLIQKMIESPEAIKDPVAQTDMVVPSYDPGTYDQEEDIKVPAHADPGKFRIIATEVTDSIPH